MRTIDHWINGTLVPSQSGRAGPVYNPATGEQQAEVGLASVDEVDAAIAAAKAAFPAWRAMSVSRRSEVMFRFRELVVTHRQEIAELVSIEHGKVPSDAAGELARGIENIEFACGIPAMLKGGYSEGVSGGVDVYSLKQPLGVVAGITPFNFPAMVPMWMFTNAIATGNTFVLKPSEKDPSVALLLADLLQQAGLPDGVFNVLQGDKVAVDRILDHPDVEAVSFVGSTPIAQYIYATGTARGKRVQALGGAKNHMVVLPDADIDMAADAAVSAAYGSAGERCMAISVVVAVGGVGDRLIGAIAERLPRLKVGPGTDPTAEMGPLITREHRDKVASYLEGAPTEGATVVVNRHKYGNGTAIFTRDGGAAKAFQYDVLVGMVGINVPIPVPVAYYSFGGWKASIFGDSNIYGPAGVEFYTRTKTITSRWPDPATSSVDLGFPLTR